MQSFGDLLANNRFLAFGLMLAALAIILAVGIGLFRLVFGRRLHMSGGRTRQPRLGVVDAFDLDRQRQLVLVRRDNVEHLIMIGGPNDVVVEAAIVRAPAALNARDKENGIGTPVVSIPASAPVVPGQPSLPVVVPVTSVGHATLPVIADLEASQPGAPAPLRSPEPASPPSEPTFTPEMQNGASPSQAPPSSPDTRLPPAALLPAASRSMPASPVQRAPSGMPSRPTTAPSPRPVSTAPLPPRPNFSRATPVAPPATTGSTTPGRSEPAGPRSTPGAPTGGLGSAEAMKEDETPAGGSQAGKTLEPGFTGEPTPTQAPVVVSGLVSGPPSANTGPSLAKPIGGSAPRPVTPLPVRQPPNRPASTAPAGRGTNPSLGSLEEEMAKLLGRPMPPSDQSRN